MTRKMQMVSELADQTARDVTQGEREWKQYLGTAARLYKYPFDDQLLIYAQRPDATACASMGIWNENMRRWVRAGSKGIALIHKDGGRPYLTYVFDVRDTRPVRGARMPYLWEMREDHHAPVLTALEGQYGKTGEGDFGERLMAIGTSAVATAYREHLGDLAYDTRESFPEGADGRSMEAAFRDTVAASVRYTLLVRCGLKPEDYLEEGALQGITDFSAPDALHHLGDAVSTLSKNILQEIGRAIVKHERERLKEAQKET